MANHPNRTRANAARRAARNAKAVQQRTIAALTALGIEPAVKTPAAKREERGLPPILNRR
jgi:hypothetical protein